MSEHNPFGRANRASEETVGVIGKKFPSTMQSDLIARFPTGVMIFSLAFPVVFMFIAIGANVAIDVSLSGFTANPHESSSSASLISGAVSDWLDLLTGTSTLRAAVNTNKAQSVVTFRQELRFDINLPDFSNWYYGTYLPANSRNPESLATVANMLRQENMAYVQEVERYIIQQYWYGYSCFENNLKYGVQQSAKATSSQTCVPLTSLTQYFYPGDYNVLSNGVVDWKFDGLGTVYQKPYSKVTQRLMSNPNYRWYLDKKFSNFYPYSRSVRTQVTLATPISNTFNSPIATVRSLIRSVKSSFASLPKHPYIYFSFGGDQVEDAVVDAALSDEYYKLGVMILIVAVVVWFHTRTVIMTICMVCQLLLTYLASWGFYITVYNTSTTTTVASVAKNTAGEKAIPLLSSISLFLIISFCLHGCLTFYDTFVHSGIMATTGRRNNLTVSQRISFCMRRASGGITIANTIAVIVFAINSSSAFQAVRDFSVMMIFALLFNIYFAWTALPAYVLWHHYYFSRKRRIAQKQREVISERVEDVRRNSSMSYLLQQIQLNLRPDEESYASMSQKENMLKEVERLRLRAFFDDGAGALLDDAKRELGEVVAMIRQNRDSAARRKGMGFGASGVPPTHGTSGIFGSASGGGADASQNGEEFQFEMFIDVNSLQETTCDSFVSERLVPANKMLHIPLPMTLRSAENIATASIIATEIQGPAEQVPEPAAAPVDREGLHSSNANATTRLNDSGSDVSSIDARREEVRPGRRRAQPIVKSIPEFMKDEDAFSFVSHWESASTKLNLGAAVAGRFPTGGLGSHLLALVAYIWCCSHDPYWVVSESSEEGPTANNLMGRFAFGQPRPSVPSAPVAVADDMAGVRGYTNNVAGGTNTTEEATQQLPSAAPQRKKATVEYTNFFSKIRHRWAARQTEERQFLFGMFGKRVNETREERDARILARATKKEGYGKLERLLTNFVAPWIDNWKYVILIVYLGLFIAALVLATRAKPAGVPKTLMADVSQATLYSKMETLFAQSGTCDFCGLYYRPYNNPKIASYDDLVICKAQNPTLWGNQMNMLVDQCYQCNGNNSCVDCGGTAITGTQTAKSIQSCGVCAYDATQCRQCYSTRSCSYCYLRGLGANSSAGPGCSRNCNDAACPPNQGTCNPYTGQCDCVLDYSQNCPNTPSCLHGITNVDGTCSCDVDWNDGGYCQYHVNCIYRGSLYSNTSATLPSGLTSSCGCVGNWLGPSCTFCACRNGGRCNVNGDCVCVGAFYGDQCQYCAASCSAHGTCPDTSVLPPVYLNYRSCVTTGCSAYDVDHGIVCAACTVAPYAQDALCSSHTTPFQCNYDINCLYVNSQCVSIDTPYPDRANAFFQCTCNGAWSGPKCSICTGPNGSTCLANGDVVACDGITYTGGMGAPATDVCGVCGGTGNCVGCDGVPNSGKVFDDCGVCGGNNGCLGAISSAPISVDFFFDLSTTTYTQGVDPVINNVIMTQLAEACTVLQSYASAGVFIPPVSCPIASYIQRSSVTGTAYSVSGLYSFSLTAGTLGSLGFTTTSANSSQLQWTFMRITVNLPTLTTASNDAIYTLYVKMLGIAAQMQAKFKAAGLVSVGVHQTSSSWANAVAAHVSLVTLKFTTGVGTTFMFGIVTVIFGNMRIALFAALGVVFVLCGTLAAAATQGWDVDAVTQICVAGVIAIAAEHLVHVVDGYQDFLQSTQSHLFAIGTTKMHAFRGALTRTGVSIVTSTVAVIAVSIMFCPSAIQPFRRAAQIIITVHILTLFATVFFGAALCAAGPLRLFRHYAVSVVMCCICGCCGGLALLIIFLAGGVEGPSGNKVP